MTAAIFNFKNNFELRSTFHRPGPFGKWIFRQFRPAQVCWCNEIILISESNSCWPWARNKAEMPSGDHILLRLRYLIPRPSCSFRIGLKRTHCESDFALATIAFVYDCSQQEWIQFALISVITWRISKMMQNRSSICHMDVWLCEDDNANNIKTIELTEDCLHALSM